MKDQVIPVIHKTAHIIGDFTYSKYLTKIFNYWLRYYDVNGSFNIFPVKNDNLSKVSKDLRSLNSSGVGFLPLDLQYTEFIETLTNVALQTQQIDTVSFKIDGTMVGDYLLLSAVKNLMPKSIPMPFKKIIIIGDSPLSKSIIKTYFSEEIIIITDDPVNKNYSEYVTFANFNNYQAYLSRTDLLINTYSNASISLSGLGPSTVVLDMDINLIRPDTTSELLRKAKARGHYTLTFMDILIALNALRFYDWYGVKPDLTNLQELKRLL